MPKIRQAIAVLAAAAFCIGFNTYRYPVVSEMVAAVSSPTPSGETDSTPKAATAEKTHNRDDASRPGPRKAPDGVVCKDGVCTMPLPDSPTASLSSTPSDESAGFESKQGEKESSRREEPSDGGEPKSIMPDEGEPPSSPTGQRESTPNEEAAELQSNDPSADSAENEASTMTDPSSGTSYDMAESSSGRKLAARLVSTSSGSRAPKARPEKPPTTKVPLIPIVRPAPRAKDSEDAEANAASGLSIPGEQGSRGQEVRRLPTVDSAPGADPPDIRPDLALTYPTTSAR